MKKLLTLLLALALCCALPLSAGASEDIAGNWALAGAHTPDGEPFTPEDVEAAFGSPNIVITLYPNDMAVSFTSGMLTGEPTGYTYDGESVVIDALPDTPLYPDTENPYYMYMYDPDGNQFTFSRQTSIEGMWGLYAAYGEDGTELDADEIAALVGGESSIMVFNYNCSIEAYVDGELKSSTDQFMADADGNITIIDPDAGMEMPVTWIDDESFSISGGGAIMEFAKIYPIVGDWTLTYAINPDGSFASVDEAAEFYGTTDYTLRINSDSSVDSIVDGTEVTGTGEASMAPGGVILITSEDGSAMPLAFDASGNVLSYTGPEGMTAVFARTTPIVLP